MTSRKWRQNWVEEKCDLVVRLNSGELGGGYGEAVILVCAILNSLSAELWPGKGIDKRRFVEMIIGYGSYVTECKTVSIPLLIQHLNDSLRNSAAECIQSACSLRVDARVLSGPDIDKTEEFVLALCPQLDIKGVRSFSYASILYSEFRSSYAHEYKPGTQAGSWPMAMGANQSVSYINRIVDSLEMQRFIHVHIEWLVKLAIDVAGAIDNLVETQELPLPKPPIWWVDGG